MKPLTIHLWGDVAEVLLYDQIGSDLFGEGVTAKVFQKELKAVKAKTINLRINSPGGSVFDAAAMVAALDAHPARIEVDVDGVAASAASLVAMAGDRVRVGANAMMMIHNPWVATMGDAAGLRKMADLLEKSTEQAIDAYERHSKVGREQIAAWMSAETWFTGQEAVEAGLAHEVTKPVPVAALAGHAQLMAKLGYRNVPVLPEDDPLAETRKRREVLRALTAGETS